MKNISNTNNSKEQIAGLDEAGRGCVLGPLVIAICVIDKSKETYFKDLGVTDSKLLSKSKRKELFEIIKNEAEEYCIKLVSVQELNTKMSRFSLNDIEAEAMVDLISSIKNKVSMIYIDCPDVDPLTFRKRVSILTKKDKYKKVSTNNLVVEHKADLNYIVVSCASILAKFTRDSIIEELVGKNISGYSSDERTIKYLKDYIIKNKCVPETARLKWDTIDKIIKELYQKKIGWFCDKEEPKQ